MLAKENDLISVGRDGSVAKSTGCSSRGPGFKSQLTSCVQPSLTHPGDLTPSVGIRLPSGAQIDRQAKTHTLNNKIQNVERRKWLYFM